jgi:hypothetical protein
LWGWKILSRDNRAIRWIIRGSSKFYTYRILRVRALLRFKYNFQDDSLFPKWSNFYHIR